jgi:2-polyprenyl-3-methyl-5-hydroxy-6-metoxy-1,4-benzoquinol methylase
MMAHSRPGNAPFLLRAGRMLWRLAVDGPYRHMLWLRWRQPAEAFQPFNTTRPDRYPEIFAFVQLELGAQSNARILSFGCATGEEVFSLRSYFPSAVIKGVDINPGNIAAARRRLRGKRDPRISFNVAASVETEPTGAYDAIFCMAVLRHGSLGLPGITRCEHLIRFEDFAKMVSEFERCLRPRGLLVIRHSNFRLCDTAASAIFETILRIPTVVKSPLFGRDDTLMSGINYPDTVFRKIGFERDNGPRA